MKKITASDFEIIKDGSVAKLTPKSKTFYEDVSGFTEEESKEYFKKKGAYNKHVMESCADICTNILKKDKNLEITKVTIPEHNREKLELSLVREKQFGDPTDRSRVIRKSVFNASKTGPTGVPASFAKKLSATISETLIK